MNIKRRGQDGPVRQKNKTDFEKLIDAYDGKLNVLVLGTSGAGKSTLINAVFGEEFAETGSGNAITREIKVYNKEDFPIRLIDTIGLEYSKKKQSAIKKDLNKFIKSAVKENDAQRIIHAVWFCIDGTVHRIDKEVLNYLRDVSRIWKDAPVIIVFTKSYSQSEILDNTVMFKDCLEGYKYKDRLNVKEVKAVVAKAYPVSRDYIVQPFGIDALVDCTLKYGPEGVEGARKVARSLDLSTKRSMAYSLTAGMSASAAAVGAIPIAVPDATVLVPMQSLMLKKLSSIYGIESGNELNEIADAVLKAGGVTMVARELLKYIKSIPGLQIAGSVLDATVAGLFTFIMGEVSIELLERTYTGELSRNETDWFSEAVKLFKKYLPAALNAAGLKLEKQNTNFSPAVVTDIIKSIINSKNKK